MRKSRDASWRSAPESTVTPCVGCGCEIGWANQMCGSCLSEARAGDRR